MKYLSKFLFLILSALIISNSYADQSITPDEAKALVKEAVIYALENKDPNMDYSK